MVVIPLSWQGPLAARLWCHAAKIRLADHQQNGDVVE
jgi:hypothetical protein